jgi:hypothetical protein
MCRKETDERTYDSWNTPSAVSTGDFSSAVSAEQVLKCQPMRELSICSDDETEVDVDTHHSNGSITDTSPRTSLDGSPEGDESISLQQFALPTDAKDDQRRCSGPPSLLMTEDAPVPQKNTFIHFDVPASPAKGSEPPTSSAPGILMRRLFKFKQCNSAPDIHGDDSSSVPKQDTPECSDDVCTNGPKRDTVENNDDVHTDCSTRLSAESISSSSLGFAMEDGGYSNLLSPEMTPENVHGKGNCTPCNYFLYKVDGCRQGDSCTFCHLCPKGEIKKRKKDKLKNLRKAGLIPYKIRVR